MGFDEMRYVFEHFLKRELPPAPTKTNPRVKGRWQDQPIEADFAEQLRQTGSWTADSEITSE